MSKDRETKDKEAEETEELSEDTCCCHSCPSEGSCAESDKDEKEK